MDQPNISAGLRRFFEVEIRNEEHGGDSPSTVDSALGSWLQTSVFTLLEWTGANAEAQVGLRSELAALHAANPDALLSDLLDGKETAGVLIPPTVRRNGIEFTDEKLLCYEVSAASGLLDERSTNWRYCMDHATFTHREGCEFILHIGQDPANNDPPYWASEVEQMRDHACDEDFIAIYVAAKDAGAVRLLIFAG